MTADSKRLRRAMALFDAANEADPRRELASGTAYPKELLYAQRMSDMLSRFAPDASEAVQLAVRAQHIERWKIPRDDFPRTPVGYKQWRTTLYKFHAETAGRLLREAGYDEAMITRVQAIIAKKGIKVNAETQLLEDVVDLVFLEHYLADFVAEHPEYDEAKWIDILQKTWKKMSDQGHRAALEIVKLPALLVPLILKAVGGE